jgi:hypothetical protein
MTARPSTIVLAVALRGYRTKLSWPDPISTRQSTDEVGLAVAALSAVIYWLCDRLFDAGRGDFFYLADAFLHGRTWLPVPLGRTM